MTTKLCLIIITCMYVNMMIDTTAMVLYSASGEQRTIKTMATIRVSFRIFCLGGKIVCKDQVCEACNVFEPIFEYQSPNA